MEYAKTESREGDQVQSNEMAEAIAELSEVQLVMVGGGFTEVNLT